MTLGTVQKGVVVVASAGNTGGPSSSSVLDSAPWMMDG